MCAVKWHQNELDTANLFFVVNIETLKAAEETIAKQLAKLYTKCITERRIPKNEFLSNLRFADDIFLCTGTPQELQQMQQKLSYESGRMGLKMNIAKTKVMVVDNIPINVSNVMTENVQGYVYLGQHFSLNEKNQDKAIQRRIMADWAA